MNTLDLLKIYIRGFLLQTIWNFERMQNVGFLYTILPAIKKFYPDRETRKKVLLRHLEFFNTHPYTAFPLIGVVLRMEEDKARGRDVSEHEISTLKMSMGGPLAAIGDSLFWATWRPFVAVLAILSLLIFRRHPWLPPFLFLFVYNVPTLFFRYYFLIQGYRIRTDIVRMFERMNFQEIVRILQLGGMIISICILILLLVIKFSPMNLAVGISAFLIFSLLIRLDVPPTRIFYGALAIGIIISFLGIL